MKSLTRVILPIAIVIGMIGGVTFVAQYSGSRPKTGKNLDPSLDKTLSKHDLLIFPVKEGKWDAVDEDDKKPTYIAEFEVHTRGHYDFWFFNPNADPVDIKLLSRGCTCSEVSIGQATSPDAMVGQFAIAAQAASGLGALATDLGVWSQVDRWDPLPEKGDAVKVAGGKGGMPGVGIVRLNWLARSAEPANLSVKLWVGQNGKGEEIDLRLRVWFVKPFRLFVDGPLQVPELNTKGQKEKVKFRCWSSTRDRFDLKVKEDKDNPCFTCDWQPLTERECDDLAATFLAETKTPTRVRSGYRVTVTVHERISDQVLLDLGPFHRRLLVTGPEDNVESVLVNGWVKGEIRLRSSDKEIIDLGSFRAARGTMKAVTLTSEQRDLQLKVDSWSPDYLAVNLGKPETVDGAQRWELTVTAPAGRSGRVPPDSAVILQTQGGRRMRIPVTGEAIQ
jgi:hypothetical protein